MTISRIAENIQEWMGWCPNEKRVHIPASNLPDPAECRIVPAPESPMAGRFSLPLVTVPRWMTATSIIILFVTLFAGGLFWWPVFVMTVTIAFTIILCWNAAGKGVWDP